MNPSTIDNSDPQKPEFVLSVLFGVNGAEAKFR